MDEDIAALGPPDFKLEDLSLWIIGRQFPHANDYWDGNWLDVIACCKTDSAVVYAGGSILHLSELERWMEQCKQMDALLSGEAHLDCMEPNLNVKLSMKKRGKCALWIRITPDHLFQKHEFINEIDQTYLPPLIQSLEAILFAYPLKGTP